MSVAIPVIDHIDGDARLIYLKLGVTSYHPVDDIYKEVRYMRRIDESLRKYASFVIAGGNVKKLADGSKRTARYAIFNDCKVVPQDASHNLAITGEQLYTDTIGGEPIGSGSLCIDKTMLSAGVDVNIDYTPPDTEVIVVITGSAVTEQDKLDIAAATWADINATGLIADIDFIKAIEGGRWVVDEALNQMIFYSEDNVTEVARFDLKDAAGAPTSIEPYERVRA